MEEKPKPTKIFPVLCRYEPTGEAAHEFLEVDVSDELFKLEKQITDDRFLSKAPPAAIEKVKARLEKLTAELIIPQYINRKLDEGEYGFEWEIWCNNEIWVYYPSFTGETGRNRFGRGFIFKDRRAAENAWTEINTYFVHPDTWVRRIWERGQREAEEARKKEYLRLKAIYEPDSAASGNVD